MDIAGRLRMRPSRFPGPVWLLWSGELIMALGVGLTQPYVVVLLHDVRGMSLATASGLWALGPLATIIGNPLAGALIDRRGARFVMVWGLAMVAIGGPILAYGPGIASVVAGVTLGGLGFSFSLPAMGTRLAILSPESIRSLVYTLQYVFFNIGLAIGAALGGFIIVQRPPTTEAGQSALPLLWLAAASACLVTIVLAMLAGRQLAPGATDDQVHRGGYRRALGDGALVRVLAAAALLSTIGYGIYNAAPSVLALAVDDPAALSFASVANCVTIIAGAPIALRLTARISARAALLCTAGLWALAWAVCIPTAFGSGLSIRAALTGAAILVGAGELLLAGALPTLVNGIAPDELRGRYNALSNLALTLGMAAGPLLTSAAAAGGSIVSLLYTAVVLAGLASVLLLRNPSPGKEAVPVTE